MRKHLYVIVVECSEPGDKSVANVCWHSGPPSKVGDKVEIDLKDGYKLEATFVGVYDTAGGITTLRVMVLVLETNAILYGRYGFKCVGTNGLPHNWGRLEPLYADGLYSSEITRIMPAYMDETLGERDEAFNPMHAGPADPSSGPEPAD